VLHRLSNRHRVARSRIGEQMRELALSVRSRSRPPQVIVALVTSGELTADIDSTFHFEQ
jgi:hypothetical protein